MALIRTEEEIKTIVNNIRPTIVKTINSVDDFVATDGVIKLDSNLVYQLGSVIDMTGSDLSFEIGSGGAYISGLNFDLSGITCSDDNYTMFVSAAGGSGNILFTDIQISVSGTGSKVYDLTDSDGTHAIECNRVNYNNCSSLGEITDYRQGLESGVGRFGGSPVLTLSGSWDGFRISTSISRDMSLTGPLFKTGTNLTFSGRFLTDMNVDLGATQAFFDFSPSNFTNNESFQIKGATVFRNGVIDSSDTTIYPNIDDTSVKSFWKDNVGLPNTQKYINANISTEVATVVPSALVYYPLAGTFTVSRNSHFTMPANGEFQLESGNGKYYISGNFEIIGTANDEFSIRVTKSTDGGTTYPTEINHVVRRINNFSGGRDVGFLSFSVLAELTEGDRVRLEIENYSGARNFTAGLDSYIIITEV